MDSADLSAMATVFPGVYSELRQKSPRLPEGKARSRYTVLFKSIFLITAIVLSMFFN